MNLRASEYDFPRILPRRSSSNNRDPAFSAISKELTKRLLFSYPGTVTLTFVEIRFGL